MSNLNVDFSKCGIEKNEYLKHFEVVEDVHIELIEKSKDSNEFVGWLDLPSKYFNSTEYKKIKNVQIKFNQIQTFF